MRNGKKIIATIEARMDSTRLPGKVLMSLGGRPALLRIIERLRRSKYLDDVIVATTTKTHDDAIVKLCEQDLCHYYRGSEDDVLSRVLGAADAYQGDIIVEITGDCPLVDWRYVDYIIDLFFSGDYDYISNAITQSFPTGFDIQIFPTSVLQEVEKITKNPSDREHVSLYIYDHPEKYRLKNWKAKGKMFLPNVWLALDTQKDYEVLAYVYEKLIPCSPDFSAEDVVDLLISEPGLLEKSLRDIHT